MVLIFGLILFPKEDLENNLNTLLFVPKEDEDFNKGKIVSRIGLEADAIIVNSKYNFYEKIFILCII